ncbi:helix-turn-helix domain-containing protein [Chitinophaga skermanii]|uniref:helix-turn-helix domain-containing protein n=1 Tax=Chitinophaga skermanii TaxID=331697 RepID=UPI001B885A99|nr:AraC family transcriptional regulator [Chitinophaga skermanii]
MYCSHNKMLELHLPMHKHQKGQFLYTEGGIVHVETKTKTYFIPARHFMWIPPQLEHGIKANKPTVVLRNLYFPVKQNEHPFYHEVGIYPANDLLLDMLNYTKQWTGKHIDKSQTRDFTFIMAIKAILPDISKYSLPLALPYPKDKRLLEIIRYINQSLDEPLLFPAIAKKFGFSERSLSRLFHQDLGISFLQYTKIARLMRALELILESKLSINEISMMVGYSSLPTFSNTFNSLLGVRPTEYVKLRGVARGK